MIDANGTSRLLTGWNSLAHSEAVAIVDDDGACSFRSLDSAARAIAAAVLEQRRSLDGERVGLLMSPNARFVEAFFGVLLAGGTVVVLSPLHPPAETAYLCDDALVKTVVVSPELTSTLGSAGARLRQVGVSVNVSNATGQGALPAVGASSPALQLYTSGTTGKPKGAVLTHENLAVQQQVIGETWGMSPRDRLLHALPLHHMHGLVIALLTALGAGACVRLLPRFDATRVWEELAHATTFMAVPTMYVRLLEAFDAADKCTQERWAGSARALRLATSGSAALPVRVGQRWASLAGSYPVERFGMTEVGVGLSNPVEGERRPGTVGLPLRSVEIGIVDEQGAPAEQGELWIRGPSVFSEYFGRPQATTEAFARDGWFRTGDTATVDACGYVRILGRTSVDILKSGGYKLSALEIEEVLREHEDVAEVAVVGVADEAWGDRVVACVVARAGATLDEEGLRTFAKTRLAVYKVPRNVVWFDELPRNALGKVLKPELLRRLRS
ncbi:MAG: acyl-CoA synthetase [Myxococcales bacterium]